MNNTETLTTSDTQDTRQNEHYSKQKEQHRDTDNIVHTRQNKHQSKQKGQSRMNNTGTLVTSDTENTRQNKHQSKQKEQHRDTDNIGYTRYKT